MIPYCPVKESWNIGNLGGRYVNKIKINAKKIINTREIFDIIFGCSE